MLALDDASAAALLSALADVRVGVRDQAQQERDLALAAVAAPMLSEAADALAARQGLRPAEPYRLDEPDIAVLLGDEPPEIAGHWTDRGLVLTGGLSDDWSEAVASLGWAVFDGHFVVQVQSTDETARRIRVRAVRLVVPGARPDHEKGRRPCWKYQTDMADVRWSST